MIAKFAFGEVIFCGDDQPRLIQCVQPGIGMLGGNAQGAIRQTVFRCRLVAPNRQPRFRSRFETGAAAQVRHTASTQRKAPVPFRLSGN